MIIAEKRARKIEGKIIMELTKSGFWLRHNKLSPHIKTIPCISEEDQPFIHGKPADEPKKQS